MRLTKLIISVFMAASLLLPPSIVFAENDLPTETEAPAGNGENPEATAKEVFQTEQPLPVPAEETEEEPIEESIEEPIDEFPVAEEPAPEIQEEDKAEEAPLSEEKVEEEKTIVPDEAPTEEIEKEAAITKSATQAIGTESATSRLGHISSTTRIYKNYGNAADFIQAGSTYNGNVYYVKKQAMYNNELFLLISSQPSSTTGVIGWVKATEMNDREHVKVDNISKTFYVKGTGKTYTDAWGSRNDTIDSNLSDDQGKTFAVYLTERVGNDIWYLGMLDGKKVWLSEKDVTLGSETSTSRLGHISSSTKIYQDYAKQNSFQQAGTANNQNVYYVKKQAKYNDVLYYLISLQSSSTNGVVGWVKATEMNDREHVKVDGNSKTLYVAGNGKSFTDAWGSSNNVVHSSLTNLKGKLFSVHLTERVGEVIWYRGVLEGKTVWLEASQVLTKTTGEESATSLLGHISYATLIYKDYTNPATAIQAGTAHNQNVYYVKKQAMYNDVLYYLISLKPSSTNGVVGWVKATEMNEQKHEKVDGLAKTFFVKGTGKSYSDAWGSSNNVIHSSLTGLQGQIFTVHLTERVGTSIWYRGVLAGKTVWLSSNDVTAGSESPTSRLGHISSSTKIYSDYANAEEYIEAGSANNQNVYYVKKQANFNNVLYYLISLQPSSTNGIVGWVKATEMNDREHVKVDGNSKTFYVAGSGKSFTDAWGSSNNVVHSSLAGFEGQAFNIHLTERIGTELWYRGVLDNKTVWLSAKDIRMGLEAPTSRLGHISSSTKIYQDYASNDYIEAGTANNQNVYYVKKQAAYNEELYYLISLQPSSTNGVVGWVKATEMNSRDHVKVDGLSKTFYLTGQDKSYSNPWGSSNDVIHSSLVEFRGMLFAVNLTERVGTDIWYRGILDGKTVWIKKDYVVETYSTTTQYNITYTEALDRQMTIGSPQTDKYRNSNAFIESSMLSVPEFQAINTNGTNLRTAAQFGDNIETSVNAGTKVKVLRQVAGTLTSGSTVWHEIEYNGKILYVHSSLINYQGSLKEKRNIYASGSTTSHVYATLAAGTIVSIKAIGNDFHEITFGAWRNASRSDVDQYMNPSNNDNFQHLLLSSSAGVSAVELNKVLVGKNILEGRGQAFIDGGRLNSVNEVYLISHALLETGQGTSKLSTGIEVGVNTSGVPTLVTVANRPTLMSIKKVYNMFGIQAFDHCADECGAKHAYTQGWDTPEKAIIGGAKFIGAQYIHNQYKQNTIYKMRWNHTYTLKQYATDIGWAAKQTANIRKFYGQLENPILHFDTPKFK